MSFILTLIYQGGIGFWSGWVLMTLWGWYIWPLVHIGLTLKQAIGIDLFVSLLTMQYIPRDGRVAGRDGKPGLSHANSALVFQLFMPAICLMWGAFYRWVLP